MSHPSLHSRRARLWAGILSLCLILAAPAAWAAPDPSISELKQAGVVGEQIDGYLGIAASEADAATRTLVERINAERRAAYARIASSEGIAVEEVAALAGARLVAAARSGHFVRDSTGTWKRK